MTDTDQLAGARVVIGVLREMLDAEREAHAETRRLVGWPEDAAQVTRIDSWVSGPTHDALRDRYDALVRECAEARNAMATADNAARAALRRAERAEAALTETKRAAERSLVVPCACGRPMPSVSSRLRCDACRAERKLDQARATLRAAANRARGIAQSAADDEAALAVLGPLVAELRALRAVRDAAEAFLSPPTLHAIGDARARLCAALDAAKAGG